MLKGKASASFIKPCVLGLQALSILRNRSLLLLVHANWYPGSLLHPPCFMCLQGIMHVFWGTLSSLHELEYLRLRKQDLEDEGGYHFSPHSPGLAMEKQAWMKQFSYVLSSVLGCFKSDFIACLDCLDLVFFTRIWAHSVIHIWLNLKTSRFLKM